VVTINLIVPLEKFRRFLIYSTCYSFIPKEYLNNISIFPERETRGKIYVEAEGKEEVDRINEVVFVDAKGVLGIIYTSKSGNTALKWRQIEGKIGRLFGEASLNSVANLVAANIIPLSHIVDGSILKQEPEKPA